ncbi:hypothetical protein HYDPIDRAFT_42348 [Hydnomerulius pinastri MD-312]|uniref:F-box domain-containing protein n=1 Tax=Hydnomerulius pinastri MD-312 TaxID=994086 RepID=A0A0C9WC78_9AGAM|nr:hypothetical protein HYDPIDRAFT_42348 [Hydnomerulius pinastri MD-312]
MSTPSLTRLTLDGRNFIRSCIHNSNWFVHAQKLSHIVITPSGAVSQFDMVTVHSLLELLSTLPKLAKLEVSDMPFLDCEQDDVIHLNPEGLSADLTLTGLRGDAVSRFLAFSQGDAEFIRITRCSLTSTSSISCAVLDLVEIDVEDDLTIPLSDFDAVELNVCDCAGFDDTVLAVLADGGPDNNDFTDQVLRSLYLTGCRNFSLRALGHMIHTRAVAAAAGRLLDPISTLHVHNGPPLTEAMRSWFQESMESFSWTVAQDSC